MPRINPDPKKNPRDILCGRSGYHLGPTHVFCGTLYNFSFFFFVSAPHARFFLWVHQLSLGISPLGFIRGPLGISLGIYPGAARDIAWDLSGGRSGNHLGFFRWPLRRSPSIFGIALGISEHVPRHFPFKIPGDLDLRSKAMERHVMQRVHQRILGQRRWVSVDEGGVVHLDTPLRVGGVPVWRGWQPELPGRELGETPPPRTMG